MRIERRARCRLTAALFLLAAAAAAAPEPASAQFNPCVPPQRPLLPIQGSPLNRAQRNGYLLEFSRYFDNLSRYMQCLSNEQEAARREYEESIQIYNQFNQGGQR